MDVTWQDIAKNAQKHRDASIAQIQPALPDICHNIAQDTTSVPRLVLTERECEITEISLEELGARITSGQLTALETVKAYLRRAGLAQKLVNCITELLPERALARAEELDVYFQRHGEPIGPLHGIPISVKEHVDMNGLEVNVGFVGWVGRVALEDAFLLKCLWEAGCVFYARTTQPQTLMHLETSSNLYGTTVNPFNTKLTPGGSSGGEGALVGLRGSCLGVATDIGGSIRVPAANNGVYGFKPTALRLPGGGLSAAMLGSEHIVPTAGPISTSIGGIKVFMKTVLDAKPHLREPNLFPMPWRDSVCHLAQVNGKPRLKIGVMWSDGIVKPHPPVLRALKEVAEKLSAFNNISIVEWAPLQHGLAWEILSALYFCDGGEEVKEAIESSGEPLIPLSEWIFEETGTYGALSVRETWKWQRKRNNYRIDYARHWNNTSSAPDSIGGGHMVDVILCPVGPGAAPPLGCSRYWGYTAVWNLLDYPALVFPVTKADPTKDGRDNGYCPLNDRDAYNHELYDPYLYGGAPVCLQLVGRRFDDEKVIQCFDLINKYLSQAGKS